MSTVLQLFLQKLFSKRSTRMGAITAGGLALMSVPALCILRIYSFREKKDPRRTETYISLLRISNTLTEPSPHPARK
jgi:hypothetical protein